MNCPTPRQEWMAILAKAPLSEIEQQIKTCEGLPDYRYLRSPEIGLVMVRGRMGGNGDPFNLGEMTVTRCVVQIEAENSGDSIAGFGYVGGRSQRHAELAAFCDALLQHLSWRDRIYTKVIQPLKQADREKREQQSRQVEATRVNFFTMVRGES